MSNLTIAEESTVTATFTDGLSVHSVSSANLVDTKASQSQKCCFFPKVLKDLSLVTSFEIFLLQVIST